MYKDVQYAFLRAAEEIESLRNKNQTILAALKHAVKTSEDLHSDYEYCREWQEALDIMRKAIKECE